MCPKNLRERERERERCERQEVGIVAGDRRRG
jgi:hypothetical protein